MQFANGKVEGSESRKVLHLFVHLTLTLMKQASTAGHAARNTASFTRCSL